MQEQTYKLLEEEVKEEPRKKSTRSSSSESSSSSLSTVQEVCSGLREYFNVLLGSQLLYKFEREQHADLIKDMPDKDMADVYGPIHLLRLTCTKPLSPRAFAN